MLREIANVHFFWGIANGTERAGFARWRSCRLSSMTALSVPISIQLGEGYGPDGSLEVESDSVARDGTEIESCLITAASYSGRNADQTELGKNGLVRIGAAVIIPREPLAPGHYQVALKEAGKLYQWRFTVAAPAAPVQSTNR